MAKARRTNIFSLAFLDVMSCGFGAVVLIFLIINHDAREEREVLNADLLAEIRLLDYQVLQGEKSLFELIATTDERQARLAQARKRLASAEAELIKQIDLLDSLEANSLALTEDANALRADIETREAEVKRLQALAQANDGSSVRSFEGQGDRQYLTGMRVGGRNVVIIIDTSGSMLDDTIVNVLRRRNMPEERQRMAPKWQRAIRTVEWIASQLPLDAEFQLYAFADEVKSMVPDQSMDWVAIDDGRQLDSSVTALSQEVPAGGTNLEGLVLALRQLSPIPDNVYLITDGLPTRAEASPRRATVTGDQRMDLFRDAANRLPRQIPINVILFPMEGDPLAGAAWWQLARATGGAFISPSWDWP